MNLKRLIIGPLLAIIFLVFFVYAIFGIQGILEGFLEIKTKNLFLGSISDSSFSLAPSELAEDESVQTYEENDNYENYEELQIKGLDISAQSVFSVWTDLFHSDEVILSKNSKRIFSIASISKLMTAAIAVENLDLSQKIYIDSEVFNQIENQELELLKPGTYYAKDLLYAMLIRSDNVASYALAQTIGINKFVELMNAKAKELGLYNTSFLNPSGLGLANFSTAEDLTKLAKYLLKNYPFIFEITIIPEFYFYDSEGQIFYKIANTNKLLNDEPRLAGRIVGGKTGTERTAGECLLLVIKDLDNQGYFIDVILNSNDRFQEIKKIIDWADANYKQNKDY